MGEFLDFSLFFLSTTTRTSIPCFCFAASLRCRCPNSLLFVLFLSFSIPLLCLNAWFPAPRTCRPNGPRIPLLALPLAERPRLLPLRVLPLAIGPSLLPPVPLAARPSLLPSLPLPPPPPPTLRSWLVVFASVVLSTRRRILRTAVFLTKTVLLCVRAAGLRRARASQ